MGTTTPISFSISAGQDAGKITDFIKNDLTPRLTQIDGVSQISIDGEKELQIEIKLNVDELTSKGISVAQVYQVLNYGNTNLPLGNVTYENRQIQMRYAGGFNSIEDIENLPVGMADNNIIRVSDVASIKFDLNLSFILAERLFYTVMSRSKVNWYNIINE